MLELLSTKSYKSHSWQANADGTTEVSFFNQFPQWKQIIQDMSSAGTKSPKLRWWDSEKGQETKGIDYVTFTERLFPGTSTSNQSPLTALGFKATDKGILSCAPFNPVHFLKSHGITAVAAARRPLQAPPRREGTRSADKSTFEATLLETQPDFELVFSEPTAITGYHIDSFICGSWHYGLTGTKVLYSVPPTEKNWSIFKNNYLNMAPLER